MISQYLGHGLNGAELGTDVRLHGSLKKARPGTQLGIVAMFT